MNPKTERSRFLSLFVGLVALTVLLVPVVGCGGGEPSEPVEPVVEAIEAEPAPVPELGVEAKLALADEVDGAVDHVVSRCAGCALAMDGNPDHALTVAGYEVHFCSEGCKEKFAVDPEAAVLALAIPAAE